MSGFCRDGKRHLVLIAAILASAMGLIDSNVVAIAVPAIRETLDASLAQVQWVHNAYLLTLSSLILVGGAIGDRFGLARVFSAGIVLFVLASLACAVSATPQMLILARLIQGIGAALMVPGSLAIIARTYPREERGAAIGLWASASAITTALGPIAGGTALTIGGAEMWRWVFAINLPFGLLALIFLFRAVNTDKGSDDIPLDLSGTALAVFSLGLLAWALTGAQTSALNAGLFGVAGLVAFALFIMHEVHSPHPMIDLNLFRNRGFSAANIAGFFLYFALSTVLFFLPMTVISAWGISEIEAAAAAAPLGIFIGALSRRFGALADKNGPRRYVAVGSVLVAISFALLGFVITWQNYWGAVIPAMVIMGIGMGMVVAPISTAVMTSVSESHAGAASGINNAVSRMSGLIAVAAMGSVAAFAYGMAGGTESFGDVTTDPGNILAANLAFRAVAWGSAALAALAALITWISFPRTS